MTVNKYYRYLALAFIAIASVFLTFFVLTDIFKVDLPFITAKNAAAVLGAMFFALTVVIIVIKYLINKEFKTSFLIPFFCGFGFFTKYFDYTLLSVGIAVLSVIALIEYLYSVLKKAELSHPKKKEIENED